MRHKAVDFSTYKKVQKFTLNEMNRWVESIYKAGFDDAYEFSHTTVCHKIEPKDLVSAYTDERLMEILLSVKGVGRKRAQQIVDKIMSEGVNPELWE